MGGQFRSYKWDPVYIVSQIISMQCIFYVGLGLWIFIISLSTKSYVSLEQIFGYEDIRFKEFHGRLLMFAFILNSVACAVGLWLIVKRTKQCLDFTTTVHFIHLLICWLYNSHLPNSLSWWLLNIVCISLMSVIGEFLCMRTELKAIPVYLGPRVDL